MHKRRLLCNRSTAGKNSHENFPHSWQMSTFFVLLVWHQGAAVCVGSGPMRAATVEPTIKSHLAANFVRHCALLVNMKGAAAALAVWASNRVKHGPFSWLQRGQGRRWSRRRRCSGGYIVTYLQGPRLGALGDEAGGGAC